eukprot:s1169_g8.t1
MEVRKKKISAASAADLEETFQQGPSFHSASTGDIGRGKRCSGDETVDKENSENLEVPGIRAINAFFRKRPASAPLPGARGRYGQAVPSYHFHNFADLLAAVAGDGLLKSAPQPPVVRPIRSPLDRRRRSLAGRRNFSRSKAGLAKSDKVHNVDAHKVPGCNVFQPLNLQGSGHGDGYPIHQRSLFGRVAPQG